MVSNLDEPIDIMEAYKLRFLIETMFKDFKSRGFNMDKNRLSKIIALFNLILLGAIAYGCMLIFGEKNKDNPLKITLPKESVKSLADKLD